ncbi:hypothetical protein ACHWQZ_G017741 [Mnemiopsis leidyi]
METSGSSSGYTATSYNNFNNLQSQLPTPPGSDSAYSPDQQNGYYSPEQIAADALTYNQCMQSVENSQIPSTTVLHQGTQLGHPTNLSPVNQVSPPQQVSPVQGQAMTSNLTPPTQLNTLFMRMQQDARLAHCTAEQQQRLLLQHEQETARRLSHMGNIAGNIAGYGQALPTIEINRVGKKRKMESPAQTIKSEPGGKGQQEHEYSDVDQETSENYRSLPWTDYEKNKWTLMLDANCRPISGFKYTVSADKGFVHSEAHSAFVSQKKNHFQVTVTAYGFSSPKFIKTDNTVSEIRAFYIRLFGFKNESKNQIITINQSTVERQKYQLDPQRVDFHNGSLTKTIPRLHFSATTENNMRKKGKPNPNQRFFSLVVSLEAETTNGQKHCLAACISERIIVRASSPSNFDLEQQLWERVDSSSIRYMGNVGINIERPDHATLAVGGNVLVSGTLNHYSDKRVKENISIANCHEELQKVKQLNLYNYSYTDEFCDYSNIDQPQQFGVLAQEVQNILPDAVRNNGPANLESGKIENVLTVNKERIYMAGVGAVKELSGITDNIIDKIDELEQVNTNLVDRFKRRFGSKSTLNSNFTKYSKKKRGLFSSNDSIQSTDSVRRTLKMMQKAVCALSGVVVLCLAAIVCLFVVMHHNANIVSSHHDDPIQLPTESTRRNVSTKPQRSRTVTPRKTYGPNTTTPGPPVDYFATMDCGITTFPGLSSSSYNIQYNRVGEKRLDCKYNIAMSPEEFYLKTNENHFAVDIQPSSGTIISQQCQYKTSPCGSNNAFLLTNNDLNSTLALVKSANSRTPDKQKRGSLQQYSYLLVSGISKITAKVRLLPSHVACLDCCHLSQGTFLDVHFSFNFQCPTSGGHYNSGYKIGTNT